MSKFKFKQSIQITNTSNQMRQIVKLNECSCENGHSFKQRTACPGYKKAQEQKRKERAEARVQNKRAVMRMRRRAEELSAIKAAQSKWAAKSKEYLNAQGALREFVILLRGKKELPSPQINKELARLVLMIKRAECRLHQQHRPRSASCLEAIRYCRAMGWPTRRLDGSPIWASAKAPQPPKAKKTVSFGGQVTIICSQQSMKVYEKTSSPLGGAPRSKILRVEDKLLAALQGKEEEKENLLPPFKGAFFVAACDAGSSPVVEQQAPRVPFGELPTQVMAGQYLSNKWEQPKFVSRDERRAQLLGQSQPSAPKAPAPKGATTVQWMNAWEAQFITVPPVTPIPEDKPLEAPAWSPYVAEEAQIGLEAMVEKNNALFYISVDPEVRAQLQGKNVSPLFLSKDPREDAIKQLVECGLSRAVSTAIVDKEAEAAGRRSALLAAVEKEQREAKEQLFVKVVRAIDMECVRSGHNFIDINFVKRCLSAWTVLADRSSITYECFYSVVKILPVALPKRWAKFSFGFGAKRLSSTPEWELQAAAKAADLSPIIWK